MKKPVLRCFQWQADAWKALRAASDAGATIIDTAMIAIHSDGKVERFASFANRGDEYKVAGLELADVEGLENIDPFFHRFILARIR